MSRSRTGTVAMEVAGPRVPKVQSGTLDSRTTNTCLLPATEAATHIEQSAAPIWSGMPANSMSVTSPGSALTLGALGHSAHSGTSKPTRAAAPGSGALVSAGSPLLFHATLKSSVWMVASTALLIWRAIGPSSRGQRSCRYGALAWHRRWSGAPHPVRSVLGASGLLSRRGGARIAAACGPA